MLHKHYNAPMGDPNWKLEEKAEEAGVKAFEDRKAVQDLCDEFARRLQGVMATRDIYMDKDARAHMQKYNPKSDFVTYVSESVFDHLTEYLISLPSPEEAEEAVYRNGLGHREHDE